MGAQPHTWLSGGFQAQRVLSPHPLERKKIKPPLDKFLTTRLVVILIFLVPCNLCHLVNL